MASSRVCPTSGCPPPADTIPGQYALPGPGSAHAVPGHRARLGEQAAFDDRIFDPAGLRPPIWCQEVPETKAGKNRFHLDLYPKCRDNALPLERRIEIVEAKVAELVGLGGERGAAHPARRSR